MTKTKRCCRCGETKSLKEFWSNKTRKDGLTSACKICHLVWCVKWRRANRDKIKASSLRYYYNNIEARRAYYRKNRETFLEYARNYRKQHPREYIPAKSRAYYIANRERILAAVKIRYAERKSKST